MKPSEWWREAVRRWSPPMRGRELKPVAVKTGLVRQRSPPMRGRELKLIPKSRRSIHHGRPPCGGVS